MTMTPARKAAVVDLLTSQTVTYANGATSSPINAHTSRRGGTEGGRGEEEGGGDRERRRGEGEREGEGGRGYKATRPSHVSYSDTNQPSHKQVPPLSTFPTPSSHHSHSHVGRVIVLLARLFELKGAIVAGEHASHSDDQLEGKRGEELRMSMTVTWHDWEGNLVTWGLITQLDDTHVYDSHMARLGG